MFSNEDVRHISLFSCVADDVLAKLLQKAADVHLAKDEWLIREGESPFFFIIVDGAVELVKELSGKQEVVKQYARGDFFGEISVLMSIPALASVRATAPTRLLRLSPLQLKFMVDKFPEASNVILRSMTERISALQQVARETPGIRAVVVGDTYDSDCREIRVFLSSNRIPHSWVDKDREPERIPDCAAGSESWPMVVIDGSECIAHPTVRKVAAALGFETAPSADKYDVVVVGAGPAGLAAGVYGASEGLRTLIVEKTTVGGQAGTSSRIENYLGFPSGISGDELSERAQKQATRLGAEIVVTREVNAVTPGGDGFEVRLDGEERVTAHCVVLATGVDWRRLDAPGVDRLRGRGVLYGASRMEAGSIVGKDIFIVGGGNSAGQAALFFSNYARSVTVLVRGAGLSITMSSYLIEQIERQENITVEPFTRVVSVEGDQSLESLCTVTGNDPARSRPTQSLFIMIGADANTGWIDSNVTRDEKGYLFTGRDIPDGSCGGRNAFLLETNLPGLFCVGDVRHDSVKRVASGVGEGSMAIAFIHQYLALQKQGSKSL